MMHQLALCLVIFSVTWAQLESEPCKFFTDCKCGSDNDTYRFCNNNLTIPEHFCKRFPRCSSIPDQANPDGGCQKGKENNNCKNGAAKNNQQTLHSLYERRSVSKRNRRSDSSGNTEGAEDCADPGFIADGIRQNTDGSKSLTPQTFRKGEIAIYSCASEEFALQGRGFLICIGNGSWSSPLPTCIRTSKVTCRDPGHIANGNRFNMDGSVSSIAQRFEVGQSVLYDCLDGFSLKPHTSITCTAEGKWSNSKPRCVRTIPDSDTENEDEEPVESLAFCQDPGVDPNGERTPMSPGFRRGFIQGARLLYYCHEGYFLIGEEELFCLKTGIWSSEAPTCAPDDSDDSTPCRYPGPVLNGRTRLNGELHAIEPKYPPGTRLDFSCDKDYVLAGRPFSVCGDFGTWSALPPKCVLKCGKHIAPGNDGLIWNKRSWPWGVGLSAMGTKNITCNAVLLNTNTVLTAARCVSDLKTVLLHFGIMQETNESLDLDIRVSKEIMKHPEFDENPLKFDVALIKFAPRIHYTKKIRPICLPTEESTEKTLKQGSNGYMAGFFAERRRYIPPANRFRTRDLYFKIPSVKSFSHCLVKDSQLPRDDDFFCAGENGTYSETCIENGSAFAFYDSENDIYTLDGIVRQLSQKDRESCYWHFIITKMPSLLPWIYEKMST